MMFNKHRLLNCFQFTLSLLVMPLCTVNLNEFLTVERFSKTAVELTTGIGEMHNDHLYFGDCAVLYCFNNVS